jgi:hypothetical protein
MEPAMKATRSRKMESMRHAGPTVQRELIPYLAAILTLMGVWWIVNARLPAFILPPLKWCCLVWSKNLARAIILPL